MPCTLKITQTTCLNLVQWLRPSVDGNQLLEAAHKRWTGLGNQLAYSLPSSLNMLGPSTGLLWLQTTCSSLRPAMIGLSNCGTPADWKGISRIARGRLISTEQEPK